jgi:glycosyltransferase involved in cell wall biosynthesis
MSPTTVAFDTGPLHGPKTGIGFAVEALLASLVSDPGVVVRPYVLSFRAALSEGTTRLPLPAAVAQRMWALTAHPRVDRWLGDAELVHGTNYVVPPTTIPTLVSVYDCWFLTHPHEANQSVRQAGAVLRAAIDRGAVVHTSSHATEALVRDLFPGAPVCTVHLGPLPLPTADAAPPVAELVGRPYVLAIGTLERRKNLPTLVRAFGELSERHPELRLVLAGGEGDDVDRISAAIDSLGDHGRRVLRTGRVSEGVRSWLLRNAAVLAYPSLDEGFGFPLLDAMQAGTPVVASTAGSIPEVAGPAALVSEPLDHTALAANLHLALSDEPTRTRLIEAGAQRWPDFSWERCAHEMIDLYGRVVRRDTDDLR